MVKALKNIYSTLIIYALMYQYALAQSESMVSMQHLIKPSRIKESFVLWNEDLRAVIIDTVDGKRVIRVFHTPINPSLFSKIEYDNDVLDYETLQPLEKHLSSGSVYYKYDKQGLVKAICILPNDTVTREINTSAPVYHLQGPAAGLFISALPLKVGLTTEFKAIFSSFPYNDKYVLTIENYELSVVGEEQINHHGEILDTYVVVIDSKYPSSGLYFKVWITKAYPHMELQFIYSSKSNPNYRSAQPYIVRRNWALK